MSEKHGFNELCNILKLKVYVKRYKDPLKKINEYFKEKYDQDLENWVSSMKEIEDFEKIIEEEKSGLREKDPEVELNEKMVEFVKNYINNSKNSNRRPSSDIINIELEKIFNKKLSNIDITDIYYNSYESPRTKKLKTPSSFFTICKKNKMTLWETSEISIKCFFKELSIEFFENENENENINKINKIKLNIYAIKNNRFELLDEKGLVSDSILLENIDIINKIDNKNNLILSSKTSWTFENWINDIEHKIHMCEYEKYDKDTKSYKREKYRSKVKLAFLLYIITIKFNVTEGYFKHFDVPQEFINESRYG